MAKTQWILLLSACVVSAVSVILYLIAFLTTNWVVAEASNEGALRNSRIEYGIFGGSLTRHLLASESNYRLQVVCSYASGACMYSCQVSAERRDEELQNLLSGLPLRECPAIGGGTGGRARSYSGAIMSQRTGNTEMVSVREVNMLEASVSPASWVSVVIFLSVGATFALVSTAFAALNIFYNPVEPVWGVLGLYIWNGIAAVCATLALIVWGALFASRLISNIAITDTLVPQGAYDSEGLASLGYSYWLLFAPMSLHVLNCGLLWWRTRIIEAEPKQPTFIVEAKQDFTHMWF